MNNAMLQANRTITEVLMAVARFESTSETPIFARTAVNAAKIADTSDHMNEVIDAHDR